MHFLYLTVQHIPNLLSLFYHSDTAAFTFNLAGFSDADFNTPLAGAVALNLPLYFKVSVTTSSANPNLDLFILSCHSSKSNDPASDDGKVILIQNG